MNRKIVIMTTHNVKVQVTDIGNSLFFPIFPIFIKSYMTKDSCYGHLQRQLDSHPKSGSHTKADDILHEYPEGMKSLIN